MNRGRRSARLNFTTSSNRAWIAFAGVMARLRRDGCAPGDSAACEKLVERPRATPQWRFADGEVDIRFSRA